VLDKFEFTTQIDRLERSGLLYLVVSKFAEIDLHPNQVSNLEMGYLYEELIRRFAELSNETAGEHFTPREVIRLMVDLLFIEDDQKLTKPGAINFCNDLRRRLWHRRHVVGGRGPPARAQPRLA
jgi:type I restriction enzyme M protein